MAIQRNLFLKSPTLKIGNFRDLQEIATANSIITMAVNKVVRASVRLDVLSQGIRAKNADQAAVLP